MNKLLALLLLFSGWVTADILDDHEEEQRFEGPAVSEVELLEVKETSPYGSDRPFAAKIRNNTALYLDRVAIKCTVTNKRGHRLFKDLVFRTNPSFSIRIGFPPVTTPEMGIPPGETTEVGLYTEDNRWTRGDGEYLYDCHMHAVSGRK